jgi:hypothetical protein
MGDFCCFLIIGLLVATLLLILFGAVKCGSGNTQLKASSARLRALPSDDLHPLVGTTCWQQAGMPFSLTISADDSGNLNGAGICTMNPDGSCGNSYMLSIAGNMLVGGPFGQMGYLASNNIFQTSAGVYLSRMDCPAPPSS